MQGGHRTQMGQREAIDRARSGVASGRDPPRDSASGLDVLQPVICGPVTVDISEHGQVVESERDVRADPCSAYERGLVGVPVAVAPGGLAVA